MIQGTLVMIQGTLVMIQGTLVFGWLVSGTLRKVLRGAHGNIESISAMCTDTEDDYLAVGDTAGHIRIWNISDLLRVKEWLSYQPPMVHWKAHKKGVSSLQVGCFYCSFTPKGPEFTPQEPELTPESPEINPQGPEFTPKGPKFTSIGSEFTPFVQMDLSWILRTGCPVCRWVPADKDIQ
jgi:WD40 repeat protein